MLTELGPLWRIAWPLLIAQTAQIGTGVVDTLMAGNYSDVDLAAIAVGFNICLPAQRLWRKTSARAELSG